MNQGQEGMRLIRVTVEVGDKSTFTDRGIPYADAFYATLGDTALSPHLNQDILALCHGAAIEHLEAAREALSHMHEVQQEPIPATAGEMVNPEGKTVSAIVYTHGPLLTRFSRALRVVANEGRACLESVVYEMAFTFQAVPQKAGGNDERAIGYFNPRTRDAFRKRATQLRSSSIHALNAHFEYAATSNIYKELESLRRVAYHRNLPFLTVDIEGPYLDPNFNMPLPDSTPLRPERPASFENPTSYATRIETYTRFCERILDWLQATLNEAYRLAARAYTECAALELRFPAPPD